MKDVCGIYVLRNTVNGKIYVGQSVNILNRWYSHRKSANAGKKSHLYDSMRKYGLSAFSIQIMEECTPEQLDEREAYWMDFFDATNTGYNMMPAGQYGRVMTDELRKWLSENSKKWKPTPEILEKMRIASTGKKHSEETKRKMSEASRLRWKAKFRPMVQIDAFARMKPKSAETRARMSAARRNESAESKDRRIAALRTAVQQYWQTKLKESA